MPTDAQILALLQPLPPTPLGLPPLTPNQLDPFSGWGQWLTYAQARQFVTYWNQQVVGLQILPGDDEQAQDTANALGIYKPFAVETYFPESKKDTDGVTYFYLSARFLDVKARLVHSGVDIGLLVEYFYRYPYSQALVISILVPYILGVPGTPAA